MSGSQKSFPATEPVRLTTLGAFRITAGEREVAPPATRRARTLIAFLAANCGREHRREAVAELLWPEAAPERSRANLNTALWQVRKAFREGGLSDPLQTTATTVAWAVETDLDAEAVLRGDHRRWGGEFLPGEDCEWAVRERDRIETLADAALREAWDREPGRELALALVERDPYAAPAYAYLIEDALRRADLAGAKTWADRGARALAEVGAELPRQVLAKIAEREPAAIHGDPAPALRGGFFGRDQAIAQTLAALERSPIVTLRGPGGVGKSRLALEVCARAAARGGHTWFVDVERVGEYGNVADAIVAALGIADAGRAPELAAGALAGRRGIVVLDGCERARDAIGAFAGAFGAVADAPRLLVTSRIALGVIGEDVISLDPLDEAAAIELWRDRAGAAGAGTRGQIAALCAAVDRLPLALEIVAARARIATPAEMRRRLGALAGDVRAVVTRSIDLLGPSERQLFVALGTFEGAFTLEALERVAAPGTNVVASFEQLIDASLVAGEEAGESRRFRLLEAIHEEARRLLGLDENRLRFERMHDEWCAEIVARTADAESSAAIFELRRDLPDIRAALGRAFGTGGDAELGRRIASRMARIWDLSGPHEEARRWLDLALKSAPQDDLDGRRRTWYALAIQSTAMGEWRRAEVEAREAAVLAERCGDRRALSYAINIGAIALENLGRPDEAVVQFEAAIEVARASGAMNNAAFSLMNLGNVECEWRENPTRALELYRDAANTAGEDVTDTARAAWRCYIADATWMLGDVETASALVEASLETFDRFGETIFVASACQTLAKYRNSAGRWDEGRSYLARAIALYKGLAHRDGLARCFEEQAIAAAFAGDVARAARLDGGVDRLRTSIAARRPAALERRFRQSIAMVRELDRSRYARERAVGETLSLGEMLAFADGWFERTLRAVR